LKLNLHHVPKSSIRVSILLSPPSGQQHPLFTSKFYPTHT
jgi:hypothetical protein